ncbi:anthranilate synthase component I [Pontibacillus marinus]|uniref:Anthranilate synthase component 1 n=1 Tax=Pontibacillus marinus BH030004 = DSM 16465 TaxID=1385511 RepID=A0A0A5GAR6_9BACI|nr:anthranilate synthase component I [Pontibacillus marinus]KGX90266.1 anthranilate synthase subunit I [Pontibacillus marinus BH030004 = DSM 16465]
MNKILQLLEESSGYRTIPVTYSFYTDTLTPIQIYDRLKDEAVYLLESGDHASEWSRYSFIGLHPFLTLQEYQESVSVTDHDQQTHTSYPSLKSAFEETFNRLKVKLPEVPLPFQGGGVGFVSYDAVSSFENMNRHRNDDLELPDYHFLFCRTLIAFDHKTNQVHIIRYVRTEEENEQMKSNAFKEAQTQIYELVERLSARKQMDLFFIDNQEEEQGAQGVTSNYDKEDFKRDVETIKEYVLSGDVFQTVLSQRFAKEMSCDGFELYRVLRHVNPSPYMFYLNFEKYEVVGSSPERLIQVANKKLEIHPIAGTRKRGNDQAEDEALADELMNDEKEKAEHFMLVDLARNDIGKVATYGTVQVPLLTEVTRFSHVMHMISKVTGELREDVHPIEAFQAAFPAGTLSGAPKRRAMEIIQELEPNARGIYGGGVVYYGFDGNMDSCITIRSVLLKDQFAYVQAGAGVVADSDPEMEWQETVNKANALFKTLHIADRIFGKEQKEDTYYA